jgi:hypothetical protein
MYIDKDSKQAFSIMDIRREELSKLGVILSKFEFLIQSENSMIGDKNCTMRTLELKDIAGYLPHRLKTYTYVDGDDYDLMDVGRINDDHTNIKTGKSWMMTIDVINPVLRPLSDLYRTITHNGKEIVPIVECAKMLFPNEYWEIKDEYVQCQKGIDFHYSDGMFKSGVTNLHINQFILFDYLHELKIDYRGLIDAGLAVDVNIFDVNPYK